MTSDYRFRASAKLTQDWQHFRFGQADGVATVTLDRPEKLNPGLGRATDLLMLGGTIDSATADRYGLASRLVADDELDAAVIELAETLAAGPTLAIAQTKSLLTRELDMPMSAALELDAMTQALLMTTRDHTEFHTAFNEKRTPRWEGR